MEIVRYHNPGNIMQHTGTKFLGEIPSPHRRLTAFSSNEYGVRAIVKIIQSYRRQGYKTYKQIIYRYAPPTENHTNAYLKFVCSRCRALPDQVAPEANDEALVAAICWYESNFKLTSALWTTVRNML